MTNAIPSSDAINDNNDNVLPITEKPKSLSRRVLYPLSYVTVEPVFFGSCYVITLYYMLAKEYIFARVASEHGLQNATAYHGDSCNKSETNQSDPNVRMVKEVSAETAKWVQYTLISGMVPSFFSTVLFGAWSDKVGRKAPLLIATFGLTILMTVYILVINLNLPLPVLFVGHVMFGFCGEFSTILACGFSHLTDITSTKWRTFRYAIAETSIGFGAVVASLSGGVWADAKGFKQPFWFLLGICLCMLIYIFLRFIGSHRQWKANLRVFCSFKPFIEAYRVVTLTDATFRRTRIILYTLCFIITYLVMAGIADVLVIFELGLPFCLDYSTVGYLSAFSQLGYLISMIAIRISQRFSTEMWLVMIGVISNMSGFVVLAFSQLAWHIILGLCLNMLGYVIIPVIRSQVSKTVEEHEVGSIFALLACAQSFALFIAAFIFNSIFSATVNSEYPGVVFIAGVALYVVFVPLYCIVYRISNPREEIVYQSISD